MSVPRPIVRCESKAERNVLRTELYRMGFCAGCGTLNHILAIFDNDRPYVAILANGKCQWSAETPDEVPNQTLVNSPSHMLSYIKRHGLAPKQEAQT